MKQRLRQTLRSLTHRPGLTVLILLIMALCIGGNASVFSVAKAVLFQDLPYDEGDRLVLISQIYIPEDQDNDFSWAEIQEWRERLTRFDALVPVLNWRDRILGGDDGVERVGVNYVTSEYFKLLGIEPALGRLFSADEDGAPGSAARVLLSYELWTRRYGQDPEILGRTLQFNDQPYTVLGVLPEGYVDFGEELWEVDVWMPATQAGESFPEGTGIYEGNELRYWFGLARLAPGVTLEQGEEEVKAIAAQMAQDFPDSNKDYTARLLPLREFIFENLTDSMRILLAGAALILLLGCANIASLLLARQAERRKELYLHLALGAGRGRLFANVLLEGLMLALIGGVLGILLAVVGTRVMASVVDLPAMAEVSLDGTVLWISVAASVLTGILFALPPALSVLRMEARGTLAQIRAKEGGRTHSGRARNGLLVFQVSVVVMLLVVAGLLLRSFMELRSADVGFNPDDMLTLKILFESERYQDPSNLLLTERELIDRLEALPGIEGVAFWGPNVPGISTRFMDVQPSSAGEEDASVRVNAHVISHGALEVMELPLLRGRTFNKADTAETPRVVMITESLAQILWPDGDALDKQLRRVGRPDEPLYTVVGVTGNARFQGRFDDDHHQLIFSHQQLPMPSTTLMVRTAMDPEVVTPMVREELQALDPLTPVFDIVTLRQRFSDQESSQRLNAVVVGMYTALALIFALLGLYGILSYIVVQRRQEIGVRMALGARRGSVLRMVMTFGLSLLAGGLLLGMVGAVLVTRLLSSVLYGVESFDPLTFGTVIVLFLVVGLVATYVPARRVLSIDPNQVLRYE
ncbi:MAG: ABC transporter permease [Acidobacteriota bacterium]|nr:ABC transporter permease [Acidobacteriota bacterium]